MNLGARSARILADVRIGPSSRRRVLLERDDAAKAGAGAGGAGLGELVLGLGPAQVKVGAPTFSRATRRSRVSKRWRRRCPTVVGARVRAI